MQQEKPVTTCTGSSGQLPGACGAMVFPYIAMQPRRSELYGQEEALIRGTLFPGLDLPFFRELKNKFSCGDPALCQLMAMDFTIHELGLYLDTHREDQEAFDLYRRYVPLYRKERAAYEAAHGPLTQMAAAEGETYTWLKEPWPWEGAEK